MEPRQVGTLRVDFAGFDELEAAEDERKGNDPLLWQCLDAMERKLQDISDWVDQKKETPEYSDDPDDIARTIEDHKIQLEEQENDLDDEFQAIQDAILLNQPSPHFRSHWEPYIEGPQWEDRQNAYLDEFPLQYLEPDPEAYERRKKVLEAFKK